jgi:hypothetical protein
MTNYYVKHGMFSVAYDYLAGMLNSAPYVASAVLHGYAGWLAASLAKQEKRTIIQEKFARRSLSHFTEYVKLATIDHSVDLVFLREYVDMLLRTRGKDEARVLLESLAKNHMDCVGIQYEIFNLLEKNFPADRAAMRTVIGDLCRAIAATGAPLSLLLSRISAHLRYQLVNRPMGQDEFAEYLFLMGFVLCIDILQSPLNSDHLETTLIALENCRVQFIFAGRASDWKRLRAEFPRIVAQLDV